MYLYQTISYFWKEFWWYSFLKKIFEYWNWIRSGGSGLCGSTTRYQEMICFLCVCYTRQQTGFVFPRALQHLVPTHYDTIVVGVWDVTVLFFKYQRSSHSDMGWISSEHRNDLIIYKTQSHRSGNTMNQWHSVAILSVARFMSTQCVHRSPFLQNKII